MNIGRISLCFFINNPSLLSIINYLEDFFDSVYLLELKFKRLFVLSFFTLADKKSVK